MTGEVGEVGDVRAEEMPGHGESVEVPVPIEETAEPVAAAGGGDGVGEVAELYGVAGEEDVPEEEAFARGAAGAGDTQGGRAGAPVNSGGGMWDDGLIARRSARWGVRRGRRQAVRAGGGPGVAGSVPGPGGEGEPWDADDGLSGRPVAPGAADGSAGVAGGAGAGETAGAPAAEAAVRSLEAARPSPGAGLGPEAAPGPEDGGGPGADGGAEDGVRPDPGAGGGAGAGAAFDSGARLCDVAFGGGAGAGAGLAGGEPADAGGRGGAYDGDEAVPRAAGRGRGGARAGYGAEAGVPGESVSRAEGPLRGRLDALRELVGLSRTRLDGRTLAEAGRVLDEAADRTRLSLDHAVVAIAGATGSGKSSLFNALAGAPLSDVGVRRPTTSQPSACAWRGAGDHAPTLLLERLGLPPRAARPLRDDLGLRGLVLLDLPDHDSAVEEHRARVEDLLRRVDAVIWVVDPEKYADAALHERYLQPLAGYAEVMFVVLNQVDRLPPDAVGQVLDDLRRLLDEDGLALGEHGEPGACVLSLSALTGEGVGDLRAELVSFIAERRAAELRLTADVDEATARLREVYVGDGGAAGLGERVTAEFEDRLAEAVGAAATGQAAEQWWLREAERACGARPVEWWRRRRAEGRAGSGDAGDRPGRPGHDGRSGPVGALMPEPRDGEREVIPARAVVEQAVRTVADEAGAGLPAPWAKAVREAGVRGAEGLADRLTQPPLNAGAGVSGAGVPSVGGWSGDGRPVAKTAAGGPDTVALSRPGTLPRPRWWAVVGAVQRGLLALQVLAALWMVAALSGVTGVPWPLPLALVAIATAGGPGVALACRFAARGPARRYGEEAERRLRESAAANGRARVLEPMAAELMRYHEVREQYAAASGAAARL